MLASPGRALKRAGRGCKQAPLTSQQPVLSVVPFVLRLRAATLRTNGDGVEGSRVTPPPMSHQTERYLDLAREGRNEWWRYALSVLVIAFFWSPRQ